MPWAVLVAAWQRSRGRAPWSWAGSAGSTDPSGAGDGSSCLGRQGRAASPEPGTAAFNSDFETDFLHDVEPESSSCKSGVCFRARWEEQVLPGTALLGRTAAAAHTQSKSKRSRSKSPHRKCLLPLSGKEISTFLHKGKEKLLCGYQDSAEEPRRLKSLSL